MAATDEDNGATVSIRTDPGTAPSQAAASARADAGEDRDGHADNLAERASETGQLAGGDRRVSDRGVTR